MSELYYFKVSCGVGMDSTSIQDCEGMTTEEKDSLAWQLAIECAEAYGDFYYDLEEYYEMIDGYSDARIFCEEDLDYSWEYYVPEKHDMYRAGGGSFMEDVA